MQTYLQECRENKEVIELEFWSRSSKEFGFNWACLGFQTNFWVKFKIREDHSRDFGASKLQDLYL